MTIYTLFPVFAAAIYTASLIFVKLATSDGKFSPTSVLALNNIAMWLIFLPSVFSVDGIRDWSLIWQPMLVGAFFAMGNFATFLCAHYGEVSLMTPIMGVKILFVLLFAKILLSASMPSTIVAASAICCAAVFLMGYSKKAFSSKRILETFALAMWACSSYAACDVLIQKFSPNFSTLSMICISNFVLLFTTFPFFGKLLRELKKTPPKTLSFASAACALMIGESILMFAALTNGVSAPLCNILYNTRGIMSVAAVLIVGSRLAGVEHISKAAAARRAAGSLMILAAVAIALY